MNDLASFIANGYVLQPDGFTWTKPKNRAADDSRKPAVVESCPRDPAQKKAETQEGHSGKFLVRITDVRSRLIDTDNLFVKWHVDCLRRAGCIFDDSPETTAIQIDQRKLAKGEFPHTEILIERIL